MRTFPRHFHPHGYPITEYGQENTHLRIRFVFDRVPDHICTIACNRAAEFWKKEATEGKYSHGKQYPVYYFHTYFIPERRVFQVDIDFLSVDDDLIEGMLYAMEDHMFWHGTREKIEKVIISYGLIWTEEGK